MASVHKNGRRSRGKASSLDAVAATEVRPQPETGKTGMGDERDFMPTAKTSNSKRLTWWADLTVILLVIFIAVAGVVGYRFLKKSAMNALDGKTVTVAYTVCLQDVPSGTDLTALEGKTLRLSSQSNTWDLGTVTQAEWDEDASSVLVSVQAEAQYRAGDGYRVSGQRLMAGVKTQSGYSFSAGDVSAVGMVVSLNRT